MASIIVARLRARVALVKLLSDHGLGQLDSSIDARDGHLALRGAGLHLVAVRDLNGNTGTLRRWQQQGSRYTTVSGQCQCVSTLNA